MKTNTADITALFDQWNQALLSGDADQVAQLYATNAILLPTVSNRVRHTYLEIRDYFEHFLQKNPAGTIDESNVRIFGIVAIHSGLYTFKLSPQGKAPQTVHARFTFVYHWFGDRWLIVEHHSSAMPE